jgi:hypothetical protein
MNIPVFDAKTGHLCYLIKLKVPPEQMSFCISLRFWPAPYDFRVELTRPACSPGVCSKAVMADQTLLQALNCLTNDELPSYI